MGDGIGIRKGEISQSHGKDIALAIAGLLDVEKSVVAVENAPSTQKDERGAIAHMIARVVEIVERPKGDVVIRFIDLLAVQTWRNVIERIVK